MFLVMIQHMFKLIRVLLFFVIAFFDIKRYINLNYVFVLIICDVMRFYICYTRVVVCYRILCIPVATHGHSTSKNIINEESNDT
jgi:hypothetical protein